MKRNFRSLPWRAALLLLAVGFPTASARAQSTVVYAMEYGQKTNRFGTLDLLNGNFTRISSAGAATINDIAYCPTNGMLYGISNSTALVMFNQTSGAITRIANLSVSGIQSLAFRPRDGVLFGATQSRLYTINPANGKASSIGKYGNVRNLGSTGQNIRFAQDGNLYVSNTGTNTDIYRVSTSDGSATWMGEAVGYPYLMLQNASSNMYGVFINLGTSSNSQPRLATFDLSSFVAGGTNLNGSVHQVTVKLVGAGTNFPANFNFSGNVPQAVTNLTVPVSATGLTSQNVVAGSTVVFSTVASGTAPYAYLWLKNGSIIAGQTNSSLTFASVNVSDAATYSVVVSGALGRVTNSATLMVSKASAVVSLGSLSQVYSGTAKPATATTTPSGLAVTFTYNGSAAAPANAGSYVVVGTINDADYQGSATNTLVIGKATGSITLNSLSRIYSGVAEPATAVTTPAGLTVTFTYNGSTTVPVTAGEYLVAGTINDANYQGGATNTLVINKAPASMTLGNLNQTYGGTTKPVTVTTVPAGLAVAVTYNGSPAAPRNTGNYTVVGTINDANFQGGSTNTLVIGKAALTIAAVACTKTYDGSVNASATPVVSGLQGSDSVSGLAETYNSKNAGAGKTLSLSAYTINDGNNGNNYQVATASATGVINPAPLTVSANNKSKIYGQSNPALTASYNGFVNGENTNVLISPVSLNTSATVSSGAGMYPITAGGAAAANYTVSYVNGTLTVVSTPQVSCASTSVNGDNQFVVSVPTVVGQTYQFEYVNDLGTGDTSWTPVGVAFNGTGDTFSITNNIGDAAQRFFRVQVTPVQ